MKNQTTLKISVLAITFAIAAGLVLASIDQVSATYVKKVSINKNNGHNTNTQTNSCTNDCFDLKNQANQNNQGSSNSGGNSFTG